jgi:hypothetical protein
MKKPSYKVTWFRLGINGELQSVLVDTFDEALAIIPHGPSGWQRYRIMQGNKFIERGDMFGPRGMPALERSYT